jgi:hypothetical protein
VERRRVDDEVQAMVALGAPQALARQVANLEPLTTAIDLVDLAEGSSWKLAPVARLYQQVGADFAFDRLRVAAGSFRAGDNFERTALRRLMEDLLAEQATVTRAVMAFAGSEKAASLGFGSSQQNTFRDTAIKNLFKPEFRNRLDETVFFNPLPLPVILQVVHKFVKELEGQLLTRNVKLNVSDTACEWFAAKGFDPVFGARPMARLIQRELKNKLADEILFGALKDGGEVRIGLKDDALTFEMEQEPVEKVH